MAFLKKIFGKKADQVEKPAQRKRVEPCLLTVETGKSVKEMDPARAAAKRIYRNVIIIGVQSGNATDYHKAEKALIQEKLIDGIGYTGRVNTYTSVDLPDPTIEGSISGRLMMHLMQMGIGIVRSYDVEFCEKDGIGFMIAYI